MKHLEPWPVSASTYQHHGCRCNGCRQAATDKQREHRRRNPDVWAAIVADEYQQTQGKRVKR